ncbi:rRNA-processing protein and EBNA1-binding protein ebp2 [Naganishia cerealis]|uniref:rRNA-processing protein and EBNA1-binding protein ebp2 n=1 Tax=Naganishia cerealis TaxID=610337 RepID=A0ACC2V954_9TREE|nr:rRNA-processing protein and EBNA1-binding protein ebp2 [Naganishia cerealis]
MAKGSRGKVDADDYQSQSLSKKDQRKLKKLQEQITRAEQEDESDDEDVESEVDLEKLAASESESDLDSDDSEGEDSENDEEEESGKEDEEEAEEEEEEEDIPLSDVDVDSDADVVPHTKTTINNKAALRDALARIELPWSKHSFQEHQSIVSAEKTELSIKDIYDDTERELAFYKQSLDAAKQAKAALLKLKVPFSRPMDYFAEMVKTDEHMDKLKAKLLEEAANKKASEEAKRQRLLKKFGKQVQVATLQERAKQKRETLDKIKSLKRKRGSGLTNDDEFQVALEEATNEHQRENKRAKPNGKRLAKDAKFGQGGKKRGMRKNDATSSADVSGFSNKKGKTFRPGKSKRSRRK